MDEMVDTSPRSRTSTPGSSIYRMMQEGRLFEKRAQDLFLEGLVKGTSHLGIGQEAVAAGFAAALQPEDLVFCTYRGHVHTLLRGAPMGALMAELLGRANGICGGKGGSMHLTDVAHGAMGSYAIVGAHMPIAAGAAWAAQGARDGTGDRVLLRRRDDEHRHVPRGAQPGRGLEAPGRVRLREQPLHGVHGDRRRHRRRASGRGPRGRLRAGVRSSSTGTTPTRSTPSRSGPSRGLGAARVRPSSRRSRTGTADTRAPTPGSTDPPRRSRSG